MTPEASRQQTSDEITRLLGQLQPTPTIEWVSGETDRIMLQFVTSAADPPLTAETPADPN